MYFVMERLYLLHRILREECIGLEAAPGRFIFLFERGDAGIIPGDERRAKSGGTIIMNRFSKILYVNGRDSAAAGVGGDVF